MLQSERERAAFLGREPDRDEGAPYDAEMEAWCARELARERKYDRVMARLAKRKASRIAQEPLY